MKPKLTWLLAPISLGAFLATWGGWAKLATMTGYAEVEMLGGQEWSRFNIGIVLPMTVEPFGALAAAVAFNPKVRPWARMIAGVMAISTLVAAGICQAVVHSLTVQGKTAAPDFVVMVTSVLPVVVLGLGGALAMLHGVRVDEAETSRETAGTSPWGRIANALGDAAASRAERLAETARVSPPLPATVPAAPPETVQASVSTSQPTVPETTPEPSQPIVSAGQKPETAVKSDRETMLREVAELRLTVHPETNKPWSYQQIADRLGISKAQANRLGIEAEQRLPGPVDLTQMVFGTSPETQTERVNGNVPQLEGTR